MKNKILCFECEEGYYEPIKEVCESLLTDIQVLKCNKCGDKCLDEEASNKLDKALEEYKLKKQQDNDQIVMSSGYL